ncbi:putative RING finger domain-containing protein [Tetraselmis virus 1]|uniref:Putative RING finger domain-containing protein n=1 Tax=Tetraselmis virus 1 TaxID=2060617 RepID=A0A2P0VNP4_9VIRU|nr:putative RING finger domain-containing protein [Tetraselmis virus 1]AUF82369.1 putative RING finger domain-containing protein [Tetraselmis virus 1]
MSQSSSHAGLQTTGGGVMKIAPKYINNILRKLSDSDRAQVTKHLYRQDKRRKVAWSNYFSAANKLFRRELALMEAWEITTNLSKELESYKNETIEDRSPGEVQSIGFFREIRELIARNQFCLDFDNTSTTGVAKENSDNIDLQNLCTAQCPSCLEVLKFNQRNFLHPEYPVVLPCGHCSCTKCLVTWRDSPSSGFNCMTCRHSCPGFMKAIKMDVNAESKQWIQNNKSDSEDTVLSSYPGTCVACFDKYERGLELKTCHDNHYVFTGPKGGTKVFLHIDCKSKAITCARCDCQFEDKQIVRFSIKDKSHFCEACFQALNTK